ncbi:hypothetical protein HYZ76_00660 [Candidatus Falkowbacteria bacterium]|nr:hypothetical protein [Candidatus Falkowbacteria bacterium]
MTTTNMTQMSEGVMVVVALLDEEGNVTEGGEAVVEKKSCFHCHQTFASAEKDVGQFPNGKLMHGRCIRAFRVERQRAASNNGGDRKRAKLATAAK